MNKVFVVVLLIAFLFCMSACDNKQAKKLEDAEYLLSCVQDDLKTMEKDMKWAKDKDYETMKEEISLQELRCKELGDKINDYLLFGNVKE